MSGDELFTIRELARRSGLTTATIKHYVNEGLLSPVKRTGKTMAWYNDESVQRLQLIRSLKKERFLPLSVIKRLIGDGPLTDASVELDHAIYPTPEVDLEERSFTTSQLAAETGVSEERIHSLVQAGVLHPVRKRFSELDAKIVQIVKQREDDGLSFSYSRELLGQYTQAMDRAVYRDIQLFLSMVLADPEVREPLSLFNRDDDSVNLFLFYARRKFNRYYVNEALEQVGRFAQRLRRWFPLDPNDLQAIQHEHRLTQPDYEALTAVVVVATGRTEDDKGQVEPDSEEGTHAPPQATASASAGALSHPTDHSALADLARVVQEIDRFAQNGALDHRLQQLLVQFEQIERYGQHTTHPAPTAYYDDGGDAFGSALAAWLTGAVYVALPPILGYRRTGMRILSRVIATIRERPDLFDGTCLADKLLDDVRPAVRDMEEYDDR